MLNKDYVMKNFVKSIWLESIEESPIIGGESVNVKLERYTPDTAFLYLNDQVVKQITYPYYSTTELRYHVEQYIREKG